jgi:serine/threonine-protein kinase RsbW
VLRLAIRASPAGIAQAQPRLRRFLDHRGLPARLGDQAELLVEEAVMNVAMHGFDDPSDAVVDLTAEAGPQGCTLVLEDAGRAFDPTAVQLPERPRSLAEAEPGGLGLVMLRSLAQGLSYERLPEGRNRLRIVIA